MTSWCSWWCGRFIYFDHCISSFVGCRTCAIFLTSSWSFVFASGLWLAEGGMMSRLRGVVGDIVLVSRRAKLDCQFDPRISVLTLEV